jgi:hypothetical protein
MKRIITIVVICGLSISAFTQNFGIDVASPQYKLHVFGNAHFSRDNAGECCSGGDFTLSLAENTAGTGRTSTLQFHNSGVSEGFMRLSNGGSRRIIFGSYQTTMGIEASGSVTAGGASRMWTAKRTGGVNSSGWTTIPGLSINFTLDRAAKVQVLANGVQRTGGTGSGDLCHQAYRKVVDGAAYGDGNHGERLYVTRGDVAWWGVWNYASHVSLSAGNHTIEIQTRASSGGNCHICMEVGNSLTGYSDCDLIITAVYD